MSRYFSFNDRLGFRTDLARLVKAVKENRDYHDELLSVSDWVKGLGCPGDGVAEAEFVAFTSPEGFRYWASGGGLFKVSLHAADPFRTMGATVDEWFIAFVKAEAFTRQVARAMA